MSYATEVLADSPVGWWRLRDVSSCVDSSGNGLDSGGTTGVVTYRQTPGPITSDPANSYGQLFSDDGSTACHHDIPPNATVNAIADVWSVEGWVKRTRAPFSTHEEVILSIVATTGGRPCMTIINDKLVCVASDTAVLQTGTQSLTTNGRWYHCVVTKNGATCKVYVDGVEGSTPTGTSTCAIGTSHISIGCEGSDITTNSAAQLAEVALYNTELSAARVLAHYNAARNYVGAFQ